LEGIAETLEVPPTDLNVTIGHTRPPALPLIVLYDDVPGGAGLVARFEDPGVFRQSIEAAYHRVEGGCQCGADTSCYGCLRNYRNQYAHTALKRGPVMRYFDEILKAWPI